ncbi:MarR family transcriptional regulator [Leifsonia sp. Root112D2]|nr:MarR family transcriptional regulator [Leifsonia sp. Root112D2]
MGAFTRIAAEHDLSLTQLRVLGILRDRRLRMAQLADYLGLDKSTLSGLIERAERRGLVARTRNTEDKRAVDVFMTDAGHELAEKVQHDVRLVFAPLTDRLDAMQQRSLTETFRDTLGRER